MEIYISDSFIRIGGVPYSIGELTRARTSRGRSGVLAVCLPGLIAATFVAVVGLAFAPHRTARLIGVVMMVLIVILAISASIAWFRRPHELWVCDRAGAGWVMIFASGDQLQVRRAQRALERAIERAGEPTGVAFAASSEGSTGEGSTGEGPTAGGFACEGAAVEGSPVEPAIRQG